MPQLSWPQDSSPAIQLSSEAPPVNLVGGDPRPVRVIPNVEPGRLLRINGRYVRRPQPYVPPFVEEFQPTTTGWVLWQAVADMEVKMNRKRTTTLTITRTTTTTTTTTDRFWNTYHCEEEPEVNRVLDHFRERGGVNFSRIVEIAYNNPGCGLRYEINKFKLTWKHNPEQVGWWGMHEELGTRVADQIQVLLDEGALIPDSVFSVQPGDGATTFDLGEGSGLMRTEGKRDRDLLWLPRSLMDWGHGVLEELGKPNCPAFAKKNVAVFRGLPLGGCASWDPEKGLLRPDGSVLPRYAVVKLSLDRPDLIDARITLPPGERRQDCWPHELRGRGMIGEPLNRDDQSCYAAIVVPYGNSVPDELLLHMARGVPIILMRGREDVDEFWYQELENGVHWIEATPANLQDVLERYLPDEALLRRIGEKAQSWIRGRFNQRRLRCYLYRLLQKYGLSYQHHLEDLRSTSTRTTTSTDTTTTLTTYSTTTITSSTSTSSTATSSTSSSSTSTVTTSTSTSSTITTVTTVTTSVTSTATSITTTVTTTPRTTTIASASSASASDATGLDGKIAGPISEELDAEQPGSAEESPTVAGQFQKGP